MTTYLGNMRRIGALLIFSVLTISSRAVPMFNVTGTETINNLDLTLTLFDIAGTSLPSRQWNSATSKYQDEVTEALMSLAYWNVLYKYDAATLSLQLEVFHKVDPHTTAPDMGDKFVWGVARPASITPHPTIGGASSGKTDIEVRKEHTDSSFPPNKHSDSYSATAIYRTNYPADVTSSTRNDEFIVALNAQHKSVSVSETSSTVVLFFLGLGILAFCRASQ